jgi:hypothetical protein
MPARTEYSIVEFTVAQAALEDAYADPAFSDSTLVFLPIYNATEPLVQHNQGSDPLDLANSQLGPSAFYVTEPTTRFSGTTYPYCTDPNSPPPWASLLLQMSGFKMAQWTGAAPTIADMNPSVGGAGRVGNGTYKYTYSKVDVDNSAGNWAAYLNETRASSAGTATVTVTGGPKQININFANAPGAGKVWRVYRTKNGATGRFYFVGDTVPNGTTFVDNVPDDELDISREARTTTGTGADGSFFYPLSEHHPSGRIKVFLHSHYRVLKGARANWTLDAEAGRAMPMRWDVVGLYSPGTAGANPSLGLLNPGIPFIFRKASLTLFKTTRGKTGSATGGNVPAVVKSVSITPGTPTDNRRDASTDTGVKEIGIHRRFDPRFEVVFEVDRNFGFDAVEEYNQMTQFCAKLVVGSDPQLTFHFPNLQIMDAPGLVSMDGGILSWRAAFRPMALTKDDFMVISLATPQP